MKSQIVWLLKGRAYIGNNMCITGLAHFIFLSVYVIKIIKKELTPSESLLFLCFCVSLFGRQLFSSGYFVNLLILFLEEFTEYSLTFGLNIFF